jgi:hypothetical protein
LCVLCADLRVLTATSQLAVTYYGVVTQSTGEEWLDTRVVLSTASPQVAGTAPVLTTKTVSIKPKYNPRSRVRQERAMPSAAVMRSAKEMVREEVEREEAEFSASDDDDGELSMPEAVMATAAVQQGQTAATYTIAHTASILRCEAVNSVPRCGDCIVDAGLCRSDGKGHKVTVTRQSFPTSLYYFCAPAKDTAAYLMACAVNESQFTFLSSTVASVFSGVCVCLCVCWGFASSLGLRCLCVLSWPDDSFICVTSIESTFPGEHFTMCLGPDPTVKIDYREIRSESSVVGVLSKCNQDVYRFNTSVKNTKPSNITVVISDQVCRGVLC